jgi:hypothetical protein
MHVENIKLIENICMVFKFRAVKGVGKLYSHGTFVHLVNGH